MRLSRGMCPRRAEENVIIGEPRDFGSEIISCRIVHQRQTIRFNRNSESRILMVKTACFSFHFPIWMIS